MATIRITRDGAGASRLSAACRSLGVRLGWWVGTSRSPARYATRLIRWKATLLLTFVVVAVRQAAIAAPGDPFGGDDVGCIPPTAAVGKCEDGVAKALTKYMQAVIKCHVKAAISALKGKPFDEELCESAPTTGTGAKEKYDAAIAKFATDCAGQCAVLNAPVLRATVETFLRSLYRV